MTVEFQANLFMKYGAEKILFKPEASPIGPILSALRDATNRKAKVFEGSGGIMLVDSYRRGITGTMPGCDLLDGIVQLWRALKSEDDERIYKLYFPICAIVALELQAGLDGFLAIEKYIMVKRKIFSSDRRRAPYSWSLDDETREEIDRLFDRFSRIINEQSQ
jgi:4-hydroxy-tetrahydrodipicolinate synthase